MEIISNSMLGTSIMAKLTVANSPITVMSLYIAQLV